MEGKREEAEAWMHKAVAWDPAAFTHDMLGRVLHANGKPSEAVSAFEKAIELDPPPRF